MNKLICNCLLIKRILSICIIIKKFAQHPSFFTAPLALLYKYFGSKYTIISQVLDYRVKVNSLTSSTYLSYLLQDRLSDSLGA